MKIACIIPTLNGEKELTLLLDSLLTQTKIIDIYIVDSSSEDETIRVASERIGKENVVIISKADFDHGQTRQFMFDMYPGYDVYLYLTQDIILEDSKAIKKLVQYFDEANVGAVFGRQLPHANATPFAKHARFFNYPESSRIKSFDDIKTHGIKAAFLSNSFAAYRAECLRDIGGFPSNIIFAEDMYVAAKMILSGWRVAYAGDSTCLHSHNYSIAQEFARYFDMGVFHAHNPWIREKFGGAGGEGLRYVKSELKYLSLRYFYLWPESILRNGFKLLGYKLGFRENYFPCFIKKYLGLNKRYWDRVNIKEDYSAN
jgi:rhamnosyltransferase